MFFSLLIIQWTPSYPPVFKLSLIFSWKPSLHHLSLIKVFFSMLNASQWHGILLKGRNHLFTCLSHARSLKSVTIFHLSCLIKKNKKNE